MQQLVTENLASLAERAAKMDQLTQLVRTTLPNPLGEHVIAANLRDETIVVVTDSPVWASRIRFYSQDILVQTNANQSDQIRNLAVKVRASQVSDH